MDDIRVVALERFGYAKTPERNTYLLSELLLWYSRSLHDLAKRPLERMREKSVEFDTAIFPGWT